MEVAVAPFLADCYKPDDRTTRVPKRVIRNDGKVGTKAVQVIMLPFEFSLLSFMELSTYPAIGKTLLNMLLEGKLVL